MNKRIKEYQKALADKSNHDTLLKHESRLMMVMKVHDFKILLLKSFRWHDWCQAQADGYGEKLILKLPKQMEDKM